MAVGESWLNSDPPGPTCAVSSSAGRYHQQATGVASARQRSSHSGLPSHLQNKQNIYPLQSTQNAYTAEFNIECSWAVVNMLVQILRTGRLESAQGSEDDLIMRAHPADAKERSTCAVLVRFARGIHRDDLLPKGWRMLP